MTTPNVPTYGSYLQLGRVLDAQRPPTYGRTPGDTRDLLHHDEMTFIVVHQVFELWFKLMLHELGRARDLLGRAPSGGVRSETVAERDVPDVVATVGRVNEILRVAVDHFRVIETMHPLSFLAFRDAITPASGFQSVQFREMEILAGLPEAHRERLGGGSYALHLNPDERARIERRLGEMTLKDALLDWLGRTPIDETFPDFAEAFRDAFDGYVAEQEAFHGSNPVLTEAERAAARTRFDAQRKAIRDYLFEGTPAELKARRAFMFITTYRDEPLLRWPSTLLDGLVEFEQAFRMFRFRHARMVERMIGARTGTGGSPGLSYLEQTTAYRIFGNLLEARNFLIARRLLPLPTKTQMLRFNFGN